MQEIVERDVWGNRYKMPRCLASMFEELARLENSFCSNPPRASFLQMRHQQIQCWIQLHRLIKAEQVARV
jgi:hypothetical protein